MFPIVPHCSPLFPIVPHCFLIVVVLLTSCQKEVINESLLSNNTLTERLQNSGTSQEDCGFVESFCGKRDLYVLAYHPRTRSESGFGTSGLLLKNGKASYRFSPMLLFDEATGLLLFDGEEIFIVHDKSNERLNEISIVKKLPNEIGNLLEVNYSDFMNMTSVINDIEGQLQLSINTNSGNSSGQFNVADLNDLTGGTSFALVRPCDYKRVSDVDDFIDVFFDSNDQPQIEDFVREALLSCPVMNLNNMDEDDCFTKCIDPRCVVDYLLNIDQGLSDFQKNTLVSRYLGEVMDLTTAEKNWLAFPSNNSILMEVYDGLSTPVNIQRCDKQDCGLVGGYHELIIQSMSGEVLTADDIQGLLEFFSVMSCDDPEIYGCFRDAQQNPDSDIETFLNEVIEMTQNGSNFLVDGCNDLAPYSDRWEWLATFNPMSVQEVSDKLEELGEEYWIQSIDNATNVNWWWEASPTVNMDFFGITITTLPNKPFPPFDQFTAEEFFDYVQDNFTSTSFLGNGNDCHSVVPPAGGEFVPYSGAELFNWTGETPITSTFEINMFDDGSVICTDFNDGENWTFSTLNAPGWFEGDSYDGFHPVSGNRQFGIIDNGDGTFTFYTSGVDRFTGWWHLLGNAGSLNLAFDAAEELWKCFMDQIKYFVEGLGGEVSADYDCTNVRPDFESLKEILEKGCGGDSTSFDEFPCHQTEDCP